MSPSTDSPTCEHGWPVMHPDPCPQCEPEKYTAAVTNPEEYPDLPDFLDRTKHPELNERSTEPLPRAPTGTSGPRAPNLTEADKRAIAEIKAQQASEASSKKEASSIASRAKKRAEAEIKKKAVQAARENFHKNFKWDFE